MAPRHPTLARLLKLVVSLSLMPFCLGFSSALLTIARPSQAEAEFWAATLGGAAIGWITLALLPKPIRLYVLGHELTHVLWIWLFGGRVRGIRIGASGGQVDASTTNALIALAPYFFPFYGVVWILGCQAIIWVWPNAIPAVWFHLGVGFTYAFHVALTIAVLRIRQPDIQQEGWFVSAAIIWLGNVTVMLCVLSLLLPGTGLVAGFLLGWEETGRMLDLLGRVVRGR